MSPRPCPKPQPPDRIKVGWCPACGSLHSATLPGGMHSPFCTVCPGNVTLAFVRYQLTQRRGG